MQQQKFNNRTEQLFKQTIPPLISFAFALTILLTGCASINRKEESIGAILAKENVLIEKVMFERGQAEVSDGVQQSESLKKAELHLSMALEEILKTNEVVTTRLLNKNQKEVRLEQCERSNR